AFGIGPWARAQRMFRTLMALIDEEIRVRRDGPRGDELVSALLDTDLPHDQVRDKLYDMIIAGYETTGIAIAWAVYEIARNERARARLLEELDGAGSDPDPDAITRLPWLDAVCHETLRIHPIFSLLTRKLAR